MIKLKSYIIDYDIPQWSEGHKTPRELNEIVDEADGYVLEAPLYYLDVNGLTKGLKELEET